MGSAAEDLPTKERILRACVKLFLEKGYRKTTVADITHAAGVSNSSFQHFFHAKDGVLTELLSIMYNSQFTMAHISTGKNLPPAYLYAVETSIQIAVTELNENVRECYLEAYTHEGPLEIILTTTAKKLLRIFGPYQPSLTLSDFYELDLGTAGMMRGYMARPCNESFTLETKARRFVTSALRVYKVPEEEVQAAVAFVLGLDVQGIARQVMEELFQQLSMRYDLSLAELRPVENKG